MEIKDIMTRSVVSIDPGESVEIAARTMARYNIGALPVCKGGKLCGILTDRDIVTRCLAASRQPADTLVRQVMTEQVTFCVGSDETHSAGTGIFQIRVQEICRLTDTCRTDHQRMNIAGVYHCRCTG